MLSLWQWCTRKLKESSKMWSLPHSSHSRTWWWRRWWWPWPSWRPRSRALMRRTGGCSRGSSVLGNVWRTWRSWRPWILSEWRRLHWLHCRLTWSVQCNMAWWPRSLSLTWLISWTSTWGRQKYNYQGSHLAGAWSHLSGAAYSLRKYSTVKIMTQAVSRQKKDILYLSPHANTCNIISSAPFLQS